VRVRREGEREGEKEREQTTYSESVGEGRYAVSKGLG